MAAVAASAGFANGQSRIALHFPERRELLWVAKDSPLFGWQVGQPVSFRRRSWVVLRRSEDETGEFVTYRLGSA